MNTGMKGQCDTSHMASHDPQGCSIRGKIYHEENKKLSVHFPKNFSRLIRIRNRSREKGIVVLNKKSGDFGSYALPRLSIESQGQEGEPLAPAQSAVQTGRSSILCRSGEKPVTIVRIS